jgi:phosphomannomutase
MIVRSISGLRFTTDESLISLVVRYATAYHQYLSSIGQTASIVIGRDGRPSGVELLDGLVNVLANEGCNVIDIGIAPTPTVQMYVSKHKLAGGIIITASHNPAEWNGLKFLNSDGIFLDKDENEAFWKFLDANDYVKQERIEKSDTAIKEHIQSILSLKYVDVNAISEYVKKRNITFVIDAVNSAGSVAVPTLLQSIGIDSNRCIPLHCDQSGIFPHTPEPLEQNLTEICDFIKQQNNNSKHIGIVTDPDADRLVLIDENGEFIGEEKTICIAIDSVLSNPNVSNASVVVNQSTTALAEHICSEYNAKLYRSAVGEINVVKLMQEKNAIIGGEGSGGVILPECHYGRDSLVGISLLLDVLARRDMLLSELAASYPKYFMQKYKMNIAFDKDRIGRGIAKRFKDADISTIDGMRITFADGWIHLRASNTEPIVRIIAESKSQAQTNELIEAAKSILI